MKTLNYQKQQLIKTVKLISISYFRIFIICLSLLVMAMFTAIILLLFPQFHLTRLTGISIIIVTSTILILQGIFTIIWLLYAWENPEEAEKHYSPKEFIKPQLSFTALLPARHEEKVIKDTIRAINKINYLNSLKEILVLCRTDDTLTINEVEEVIRELKNRNIRLITFSDLPINKPHSLNIGLREAKGDVVTIFDAEDEPHPNIYNIINTTMIVKKVDIVQSGVQLMNYRSHWFSAINVMEYYFWFKSGLQFFSNVCKATPLGGNTVFFKKELLKEVNGWDEKCLTEDADIGIRLFLAGGSTHILYDEEHVTKEETPNSVSGFIKQRTRWNQGFLQILIKGDWLSFPSLKQRLTTLYILITPEIQALFIIYIPLGIIISRRENLPIILALYTFLPLLLFMFELVIFNIGIYEFAKSYKLKYPFWMPLKVTFYHFPYQLLLFLSSLRALKRIILNNQSWEKTYHINAHRDLVKAFEHAK